MVSTLIKKLANLEEGYAFAESIYHLYKGKTIEVYLGEKSGSLQYADFDVEQKVYVTGEPVGAHGQLLLMKCVVATSARTFVVDVSINAWSIVGVMQRQDDGLHISHIFQEMRR
jgi:hypothetical protein